MIEPAFGRRRIEKLKQLAYDCNLTNEQARAFGKLSATATWEHLLISHGLEFDPRIENTLNTVATTNQELPRQINLLEWVDFSQLIAFTFVSVWLFVLLTSVWPHNPLKILPVKINIQIGK